ncbi:MAG: DUF190 domain-containing protein [Negativicutes bacterium]|nr:DUF190 domain-containing protein [Negativicutes bacterium]
MAMEFEKIWILKIYTAEDTYYQDKPLYKAIIDEARQLEIAGGTVFKCIEGYATEMRGLASKPLIRFSEPSNLPIVLEIIDKKEKLEKLLPFLEKNMKTGLVTFEECTRLVTDYLRATREAAKK